MLGQNTGVSKQLKSLPYIMNSLACLISDAAWEKWLTLIICALTSAGSDDEDGRCMKRPYRAFIPSATTSCRTGHKNTYITNPAYSNHWTVNCDLSHPSATTSCRTGHTNTQQTQHTDCMQWPLNCDLSHPLCNHLLQNRPHKYTTVT